MPIAVASRTREHGRWWETLSSPKLACARPRPGVIGTRTARHRPANRSMASTCVSAAPGWLVRPPARALQSVPPGASRSAGRQVSKGRALGERSRRACDGVGVRRRWHGGVSKRRGARLEKFQEDAARLGGLHGHRRRSSSESGIGNGADQGVPEETHAFGVAEAQRGRIGRWPGTSGAALSRPASLPPHAGHLPGADLPLIVAGLAILFWSGVEQIALLGAVVLILVRAGSYGQQAQGAYQGLRQTLPYLERVQEDAPQLRGEADGTARAGERAYAGARGGRFRIQPGRPVLSDIASRSRRRGDRDRRPVGGRQVDAGPDPPRSEVPRAAAATWSTGCRREEFARDDWHRCSPTCPSNPACCTPRSPRTSASCATSTTTRSSAPPGWPASTTRSWAGRGLRHGRRAPRRRGLRRPAAADLPGPGARRAARGARSRRADQPPWTPTPSS